MGQPDNFDAVVVGAGFGGLHAVYRLREDGLAVLGIEAGDDAGGAWYWNRYPGARCDIESLAYSYSFSPELDAEWRWSHKYSPQSEIKAYLQFAADRLDLRKDYLFNTRAESATFDTGTGLWTVATDTGRMITARYVIMATGPLTEPVYPDIAGLDTFDGDLIHSARWPDPDPDFTGKRVGIIGTGSSGVQLIPLLAERAQELTVFVRTANFTMPAFNRPLTDDDYSFWADNRAELRAAMRRGAVGGGGDLQIDSTVRDTRTHPARDFTPQQRHEIYEARWQAGGALLQGAFNDVMIDADVNTEVSDFVRDKIRSIVTDPERAETLVPQGFHLGTRRLCVGTDYYETYNRDNVNLVHVKANPIERITPKGVVVDGHEIPLDVLIVATGFDAVTGAVARLEIKGDGGVSLADTWSDGPQTYLGLMVAGFPNLFFIGGPGSPSVFSNVVMTNELQVDYVGDLISHARSTSHPTIAATPEAQDRWTDRVGRVADGTLLATADSWYVGANVPGKPRALLFWAGGIVPYLDELAAARDADYAGFTLS